jgi:ribose transport system permease protein
MSAHAKLAGSPAVEMLKKYGIFLVLVLLVIYFSATTKFLSSDNIFNVLRQISMLGIASVGMAFVLLLGGIDLSIGSVITLVNIVAAWLMVESGIPVISHPVVAVIIALAMSTAVGFANGWIIANIKMPALIVTLANMTMLEGAAYMICKGVAITGGVKGFADGFKWIGQGYLPGDLIPVPVVVMIFILLIGAFILNKTYFGRYFYAVGGNEEAAILSGINVKRVKYLVYGLSGFFAGVAGIVMLARTGSGQVLSGKGFEFEVLTAVVLGGVSVNGGVGKIYKGTSKNYS